MEIENVKIDWAPVLESQIRYLEDELPGRGVRETFQKIISDLNENRIKSRLILAGTKPAGYAYYTQPGGMTDRILGNVGFVDPESATVDRARKLLEWIREEGKGSGRIVMINDIFNGNAGTETVLSDLGFKKIVREMMEIVPAKVASSEVVVPEGYEITGLHALNIEEYTKVESAAYEGSEDELMFSTRSEEKKDLTRDIFEGRYGEVITSVSRTARFHEKLVGACIVTSSPHGSMAQGYPLIIDVFTDREHRNKGIARALLLETIRRASGANINTLYLWVNMKSPARDLYEYVGFKESDYPREIIYYYTYT